MSKGQRPYANHELCVNLRKFFYNLWEDNSLGTHSVKQMDDRKVILNTNKNNI